MSSRAFVTVTHVQAHARTQRHAQAHAQRLQQMHWGNLGLSFLPRATSAYGLEELDNLLYLLRPNHQLQYHYGC